LKRLIVNADDFGRTEGVNSGILEAHERGLVTSTTTMVAWPAAEAGLVAASQYPRLGVGLHVALTGGPSLLAADRLPGLVGDDGQLPRRPEGLTGVPADVLREEILAQLDRFQRLAGRLPTHLDTHHHSHEVPAVLDALVPIAVEHGLPVRGLPGPVACRLAAAKIPQPDHFEDAFYAEGATLPGLLRILETLPEGATELMCHPAHVDDALGTSSYAVERQRELEVLTSADARHAIERLGIELVSFEFLSA
jgi:predicted glycoside hydrolase/deacetylase ChbG (UPF0249 family)